MQTTEKFNAVYEDNINVLQIPNTMGIDYCRLDSKVGNSFLIKENMLLFVIAGQLDVCFGKTNYPVTPKQLVFIRRNISFEYYTHDLPVTILLFELKNDVILEFATMIKLPTLEKSCCASIMVNSASGLLLAYMSSLQMYFLQQGRLTANLAKIKLIELLFCISGNDQEVFEQLLHVREYFRPDITSLVEENLMNALSLTQLARLAGRSVSSLRRDFHSTYNMSPSRLIRQKKLEKARELLVNTNMTVTNICYTLGFESVAHFSRAFKSHFRNSPTVLRLDSIPNTREAHPANGA